MLSRRQSLKAAAGLGALTIFGQRFARGEKPVAQLPALGNGNGFYQRKIGTFDVAVISDGTFPLAPPFPLFGANASEKEVSDTLAESFLRADRLTGHVNALLVRTGKETLLIDTGCGTNFGPTTGFLVRHLANLGVAPSDINAVLITHAHPDHLGGLIDPAGQPVFSKAEVIFTKAEQAFWTDANPDLSKSGTPDAMKEMMVKGAQSVLAAVTKQARVVGSGDKLFDGIELVDAAGHTPGHVGVLIASGSDQLLYVTDAVHAHQIQFAHPDWFVAFDTDPNLAVTTRKKLLDRAAADRLMIAGAHLPFPAFGHVRSSSGRYDWVPTIWEW